MSVNSLLNGRFSDGWVLLFWKGEIHPSPGVMLVRSLRNFFLFFLVLACSSSLSAQFETEPKSTFCYQYRLQPAKVLLVTQSFNYQSYHTSTLFSERFQAEHPNPPNLPVYARQEFQCVSVPVAQMQQGRQKLLEERQKSSFQRSFPLENVIVDTKGLFERDLLFLADAEAETLKKPMYVACIIWSNGNPGYVIPPFVSTYPAYDNLAREAKDTIPKRYLYGASPHCEAHVTLAMVLESIEAKKTEYERLAGKPVVWNTLAVDGSKTAHVDSPRIVIPGLNISAEIKPALAEERAAQSAPPAAEKPPPGKLFEFSMAVHVHKVLDDEKMHSKYCYTKLLVVTGPPGWGDARYEVTDKALVIARRKVKAFEESCHTLTGWDIDYTTPDRTFTTIMWNLPGEPAGHGYGDRQWRSRAAEPDSVFVDIK